MKFKNTKKENGGENDGGKVKTNKTTTNGEDEDEDAEQGNNNNADGTIGNVPAIQQQQQQSDDVVVNHPSSDSNNNSDNNDNNNDDNNNSNNKRKLSKSNRLKGYIFLLLFSIINVDAALQSNLPSYNTAQSAVLPSDSQRSYAITIAFISILITGIVVLMHLDRITCLKSIWFKVCLYTLCETLSRNEKIIIIIM